MVASTRRIGEVAALLTTIAAVYVLMTTRQTTTHTRTIVTTVRDTDSCGYSKPTDFMIEVYKKQATERRERLEMLKHEADDKQAFAYLYNNLAPEVYCAERIKVGTTDDGGKWMCSPQRLPENCVVYALGISNVITYERDLQKWSHNRCRLIAVDQGKQTDDVITAIEKMNGVVIQARIGTENNDTTRTLKSILVENGVEAIEILKIDIEGAELTTMETFLDSYEPAQIMIEVHGKAAQTVNFLQMIASKGYYLIHYEINGRWHKLAEYAFLHQSKLEDYHATLMSTFLKP